MSKYKLNDLDFENEDKLRHEVSFLRERVKNLEVFKKMFFTLQEDLVEERHRVSDLESQFSKPDESDSENFQKQNSETSQTSENIESLKQELQSANQMAMLSITTAGEYSAIIEFFRDCGSASNYRDMVQLLHDLNYVGG